MNILLALVVGVGVAARYLPLHLFARGAVSSSGPGSVPSSFPVSSAVSSPASSFAPASSVPASSAAASSTPASSVPPVSSAPPFSPADSAVQAPAGGMVPPEYFKDAIFVGDSLTEGLMDYGNLDEAQYFCHVGLNVYQLFENPKKDDISNLTLEETLEKSKFRKVYIHLGINELGTADTDYFVRHYSSAIKKIQALEPGALVFVESIYPVTKEKSDTDKVFRNSYIKERNDGLRTLDNGKDVFFLDLTPVLGDGNGNMRAECSGDDVHPKAKYYPLICDRIREATAQALASAGY